MENKNLDETSLRSGIRIKELRTQAKMTQTEFGKIVNVSKACVSHWEQGNVQSMRHKFLKKIANYFNVNPLWLMGYDSPKEVINEERLELMQEIDDACQFLDEEKLNMVLMLVKSYINK